MSWKTALAKKYAQKKAERKAISDAKKKAYSKYKKEKAKADFEAKLEKAKTAPQDRALRRKQRQEALKNKVKGLASTIQKKMNEPTPKGKKRPDMAAMFGGGMNFGGNKQSNKPMKFGNPLAEFDKPKKQKKHNPNNWY